MKKIMFVMLLFVMLCASNAISAGLEGFMGVPWGATQGELTKAIVASGGVLDKARSKKETLMFSNVKFAGSTVDAVIADFFEDRLCRAMVFDDPENDSAVIDRYNLWKKKITGKYGEPANDFKFFKTPYEEGDGYEIQAISKGKGQFASYWFFEAGDTGDSISIKITSELYVVITYEDSELASLFFERRKQENNKDL